MKKVAILGHIKAVAPEGSPCVQQAPRAPVYQVYKLECLGAISRYQQRVDLFCPLHEFFPEGKGGMSPEVDP